MATLKTFLMGESVTINFILSDSYILDNIEEIKVYLGSKLIANERTERLVSCKVKSSETKDLLSTNKLTFWIDDLIFGVQKVYIGDVCFDGTNAIASNESTREAIDIVVPISITEDEILVGDVVYNYVKGDKGDTGNGIESITLLATAGLVKTYRILYTDTTTFDYDVTDGEDGNGIESITLLSTVGLIKTYRITFTDDTTFDYTVTDGANGHDGDSFFELESGATTEHPRWDDSAEPLIYGVDAFNFNALPAGSRNGDFGQQAFFGASQSEKGIVLFDGYNYAVPNFDAVGGSLIDILGRSIRLFRLATSEELLYSDGQIIENAFTDVDGNVYSGCKIGEQIWTRENLQVTKLANGDAIPTGFSDLDWSNLTTKGYSTPEQSGYGLLYNFFAISGLIVDYNWAVPTEADFTTLTAYIESLATWDNTNVGKALKSIRQVNSTFISDLLKPIVPNFIDGRYIKNLPLQDLIGLERKGVAQSLIDALKGGVVSAGDTLAKLYALIGGKLDATKAAIEGLLTGVISTHSHTGTKADVGLSNVDNTSDLNKPISTAQQSAISNRNLKSANLSDVSSVSIARTNLGVYSKAETDAAYEPIKGTDDNYVTDAEKLALHAKNTDTKLVNGTHEISLDASGTLHIENISQVGSTYETHAEQIFTAKDKMILRDEAVAGLGVGERTGLTAKLYDGVNDGEMSLGADGFMKVGDAGDLQTLATREDTPIDGGISYYDAVTFKFKTLATSFKTNWDEAWSFVNTYGSNLTSTSGANTGNETQDSIGALIETTELETVTDTTKIASSDSEFLKWFSGLTIYTYLKGKFDTVYASLSGGNSFTGLQSLQNSNADNLTNVLAVRNFSGVLKSSINGYGNYESIADYGPNEAPLIYDSSNWTLTGGWAFSGDFLDKSSAGTTAVTALLGVAPVIQQVYKVTFTVGDSISAGAFVGNLNVSLGGASSASITAIGTYTLYITAVSNAKLTFTPTVTGARFSIGDISVEKRTDLVGDMKIGGDLLLVGNRILNANTGLPVLYWYPSGALYVPGSLTVGSTAAMSAINSSSTVTGRQLAMNVTTSATTTGAVAWALSTAGKLHLSTALTGTVTITTSSPSPGAISQLFFTQGTTAQTVNIAQSGVTFRQVGTTTSSVGSIALQNVNVPNVYYAIQLDWTATNGCYITVKEIDLESDSIALSNNGAYATDLTVGVKLTETVKFAETWYYLAASVATAPTGATLIVQVKKNGTSIFSTLLSIDATETTSVTAATPYVIATSPTVWAVGDIREYSITQVGAVVAGKGLVLTVKKTN